ncbi:craniofacial development protein 2-like [Amyelois transitella]|uniref:craniofacial development protein 2-like n=1 Tax=Amyelois transitella TaxID=680683 RepID=UPI00298FB2B6|nr:craniofacial development protein 2-like [Amyelois transitella]
MGDFNGRIGKQKQGEETIIGKNGTSERSKNGTRMALENNLKFMNSCFKIKECRRWTWIRGDGKYRNEIDYIASNHPKAFQNLEIPSYGKFKTRVSPKDMQATSSLIKR